MFSKTFFLYLFMVYIYLSYVFGDIAINDYVSKLVKIF